MRLQAIKKAKVIFICLFLGSCSIFFPYKTHKVPNIEILLVENDFGLANKKIFFGNSDFPKSPCSDQHAESVTDAEGYAMIDGYKKPSLQFVLGDKVQSWEICVKNQNESILLWKAEYIGDLPEALKFKCDLKKETFDFKLGNIYGRGLCELIPSSSK